MWRNEMDLVKRLAAPTGVFLLGVAGITGSFYEGDQHFKEAEIYKTPQVEWIKDFEKTRLLDREFLVNNPEVYLDMHNQHYESLLDTTTRKNLQKYDEYFDKGEDWARTMFMGVFVALMGLGWGVFKIGRYNEEKKHSQKA